VSFTSACCLVASLIHSACMIRSRITARRLSIISSACAFAAGVNATFTYSFPSASPRTLSATVRHRLHLGCCVRAPVSTALNAKSALTHALLRYAVDPPAKRHVRYDFQSSIGTSASAVLNALKYSGCPTSTEVTPRTPNELRNLFQSNAGVEALRAVIAVGL